MSGLATIWQAVLDLWAPLTCVGCGVPWRPEEFCDAAPPVRGLRAWDGVPLCRGCGRGIGPPLRAVVSTAAGPLPLVAAAGTGAPVAGIIHAWKYHGQRGLVGPLAASLEAPAHRDQDWGARELVPVPLHPRRRRVRGFNQSSLLARVLARHLGAGLRENVVRRVRATGQQARLSGPEARGHNVAGAFAARPCPPAAAGVGLVVVDDVVTSGATVRAVSEALAAAGWRVHGVLALATSLPSREPMGPPGPG